MAPEDTYTGRVLSPCGKRGTAARRPPVTEMELCSFKGCGTVPLVTSGVTNRIHFGVSWRKCALSRTSDSELYSEEIVPCCGLKPRHQTSSSEDVNCAWSFGATWSCDYSEVDSRTFWQSVGGAKPPCMTSPVSATLSK